jgi:hypothetical protein
MIYYDTLTWGVKIIQIEACDNYDSVQHLNL